MVKTLLQPVPAGTLVCDQDTEEIVTVGAHASVMTPARVDALHANPKTRQVMTKDDAKDIARRYNIVLDVDFHTLTSSAVQRVIDAADERKYRKPKSANGSRARYFHAALVRAASRKE